MYMINAEMTFQISRKEIQEEVYRIVQLNINDSCETGYNNRKYCSFKHKPSVDDWIRLFMDRHHLSSKKATTLEKARLLVTLLYQFYDLLKEFINIIWLISLIILLTRINCIFTDLSRINIVGEKENEPQDKQQQRERM